MSEGINAIAIEAAHAEGVTVLEEDGIALHRHPYRDAFVFRVVAADVDLDMEVPAWVLCALSDKQVRELLRALMRTDVTLRSKGEKA